jgi:O-antigen/teichoic acid export membrane protein
VRRVARNTGVQVGSDLISKVATFAFYVVLARALGKGDFGVFTLAVSVVVLIEILGVGTDFLVIRGVARERSAVHDLFWNSLVIKVIVGLGGTGVALLFGYLAGFGSTAMLTIALMAASKVVDISGGSLAAVLRGIEEMAPVALALALQRTMTAVLGSVALLAFGLGLVAVALIYLASSAVAFGSLLLSVRRRDIRPRREVSMERARRLFTGSLALGVTVFSVAILARADVVILSLFESANVVGLYGAAYRLFEGTIFLTSAFGIAIYPVFSRLGRDTSPPLRRACELASKAIVIVLFPVGAALILFGPWIVTVVFGDPFAGAATAARFLGVAAALYGPYAVSAFALASQDRQRALAWIVGVSTVANIALNLTMIPAWSLDGAAAAMAITQITLTSWAMALAAREVGGMTITRIFLGPAAGCLGMAAVALFGTGAAEFGASILVYGAAVLIVERSLFRKDLTIALDAFRRRPPAGQAEQAAVEAGQSL